jgi:hypothetical protein
MWVPALHEISQRARQRPTPHLGSSMRRKGKRLFQPEVRMVLRRRRRSGTRDVMKGQAVRWVSTTGSKRSLTWSRLAFVGGGSKFPERFSSIPDGKVCIWHAAPRRDQGYPPAAISLIFLTKLFMSRKSLGPGKHGLPNAVRTRAVQQWWRK